VKGVVQLWVVEWVPQAGVRLKMLRACCTTLCNKSGPALAATVMEGPAEPSVRPARVTRGNVWSCGIFLRGVCVCGKAGGVCVEWPFLWVIRSAD
jgi:hypothetical protein